jgi:hypothetical protein
MFDDFEAYFYHNVLSAYKQYLNAKKDSSTGIGKDIFSALTAASALYHVREHLPVNKGWNEIVRKCPDYALLGDITNVSKHRVLEEKRHRRSTRCPLIKAAQQIYEVVLVTEFQDDDDPYYSREKVVYVKLNDNSERDLHEVLTNVINFWLEELAVLGLIKELPTYPYKSSDRLKTRQECQDDQLDLEMTQGLRFELEMRLRKYNYQNHRVESVDLTGCEAAFRIYQPAQQELILHLTHNETGEMKSYKVQLTDSEQIKLQKCTSEEEKENFLREFAENHSELTIEEIIEEDKTEA